VVGAEYLQQVLAANPTGAPVSMPVTWRVSAGLPDGLIVEPSSSELLLISGRPTQAGLFRFRVEAVDGQGRADAVTFVLTVGTAVSALSSTLPEVVAPGSEVSARVTAAPEIAGGRYFLRDGQLPPGLLLSPDGAVTGTVTADATQGAYSFSVGYGVRRDALVGLRTLGVVVSSQKSAPRSGCAAVGGGELWLVAAVVGVLRRRRRA
jgi:hypothetical protein